MGVFKIDERVPTFTQCLLSFAIAARACHVTSVVTCVELSLAGLSIGYLGRNY